MHYSGELRYLTDPALPLVPIAELHRHPRQVNEPDVGTIAHSIKILGFFGDVYVQRSTNTIVAGHGRVAAAAQVGYDDVPVCYLDVDDDTATRILLVDNEAARKGRNQPEPLLHLLAELAATTELQLDGTGFTLDDLQDLSEDAAKPMFPTQQYLVVIPCEDADSQARTLRDVREMYEQARAEVR